MMTQNTSDSLNTDLWNAATAGVRSPAGARSPGDLSANHLSANSLPQDALAEETLAAGNLAAEKPVEANPAETGPSADPPSGSATAAIDERLERLERLLDELQADDDADTDGAYYFDAPPLNLPADFCLSIVVPVFNEQNTILPVLAKLLQLDLPKEIIVVDDGSTDGTRDKLSGLAGIPELRVVLKERNEGKGAALRTGFEHAKGSIVLVQDADLEYDPRQIPRLVAPIVKGDADVVYGSRFLEDDARGSSWLHRAGNRFLTTASNWTTGLRLTDMETCYKVFRSEVLNSLTIRQNRFGFEPEVTAKLARRRVTFVELPIYYRARDWQDGKKIGFRDGINAIYCILRYAVAE